MTATASVQTVIDQMRDIADVAERYSVEELRDVLREQAERLAAVAPAGMVLRDAARYEHLRERFAETMLDSLFGIDQDPCVDSTVQLDAAVDADMADDALRALLAAPTPPATAGEGDKP